MKRKKLNKNDRYFISVTQENPNDKELILKNMQNCVKILEYIDEDLFEDTEFVKKVLFENGMALQYMPQEIQNNKELVILAINNSAGFALKFASEELRADKEVVKESIKKWKSPLKYASNELQQELTKEIEQAKQKYEKH